MSARGCGTRKRGGIYSTCPLGDDGKPVEDFIIDPPIRLETSLAPQGVSTIVREGVTHIIDWVGSNSYPNVADFVEEVRRMGMSRRVPSTFDFSKLTIGSCHILVHARAIVAHPELYRPPAMPVIAGEGTEPGEPHHCPKTIGAHQLGFEAAQPNPPPMCAGIWWEDLDPFDSVRPGEAPDNRDVRRVIPSGTYTGLSSPVEIRLREYVAGMFLMLPILRLEIVRDTVAGSHEETAARACRARLPAELVDE